MNLLYGMLAATLFVSPGAWVAFSVCDAAVPRWIKWALAIVLSPACMAVEVVALAAMGIPFGRAVPILALSNLASLAFAFFRQSNVEPRDRYRLALAMVAWFIMIAPIAAFWIARPEYRVYGWHNAMNTAIAYEVADLPTIPEDPDLAGMRLNYGWLGHVQMTAIAWQADVAPTVVFPWINALMLLATLLLMQGTMEQFAPRGRLSSTLASALVLCATMITGLIVYEIVGARHESQIMRGLSGDLRVAPILSKFHNFDAMVIGIAATAGIVWALCASWTMRARRTWLLIPVLLATIALCYPIMFPPAAILAGVAFVASCFAAFRGDPPGWDSSLRRRELWFALGCAVAAGVLLAYVRYLGEGYEPPYLGRFSVRVLGYSIITAFHVLLIWMIIAWPAIRDAIVLRRAPQLVLVWCCVLLLAAALIVQMKGYTHYKIFFVIVLALAPLLLPRFDGWFVNHGRWMIPLAWTLIVVLSVTTAALIHRNSPKVALASEFRMGERSFALKPPAGDARYEWINAVRERAPRNAVLVAPPTRLPLAVLTERAQYLSTHGPDDPVLGYTMGMDLLLTNKGYPSAELQRRHRNVEACYAQSAGTDYELLVRELRVGNRPLAIAFPSASASFGEWLRAHQLGREIYADHAMTLWLIE